MEDLHQLIRVIVVKNILFQLAVSNICMDSYLINPLKTKKL